MNPENNFFVILDFQPAFHPSRKVTFEIVTYRLALHSKRWIIAFFLFSKHEIDDFNY